MHRASVGMVGKSASTAPRFQTLNITGVFIEILADG